MEYPRLKEILNKKSLLPDEEEMWLAVGIYVTSDTQQVGTHSYRVLYDAMDNWQYIGAVMGGNIRQTVIANWTEKKRAPKPVRVPNNLLELDSLDISRG